MNFFAGEMYLNDEVLKRGSYDDWDMMVDANGVNKQIASINLNILKEGENKISFKTHVYDEEKESRFYTQIVNSEGKAYDENIETVPLEENKIDEVAEEQEEKLDLIDNVDEEALPEISTFGARSDAVNVSSWSEFMAAVSSPSVTQIDLKGNITRTSGSTIMNLPSKDLIINGNGNLLTLLAIVLQQLCNLLDPLQVRCHLLMSN
ncbi:pectate lyase-like adhesive domain-containing protein [endosymbiont 'TC1' of Trimyema compressum]|uniref:pectate lyase-like adhesive domain-containing protein n=1 Tax=endosymbiont 'TC1' of Trimyema compressum TaxID=243899 RepID=UPI00316AD73F